MLKNYKYFVVTKRAKSFDRWVGCSYVRIEVTKTGGFVSPLATPFGSDEFVDQGHMPCGLVIHFKNIGDLKEVPEAELALIIS